VHGLVALMEIQGSRSKARVGRSGEPILLLNQNRSHWDHLLIRRGLAALDRAEKLAVRGVRTLTGRDCRLSCASAYCRRNGLAAHSALYECLLRSRHRRSWS